MRLAATKARLAGWGMVTLLAEADGVARYYSAPALWLPSLRSNMLWLHDLTL